MTGRTHPKLQDRLRAAPSQSSVPGSLPVLFFGDLFSARLGTIGLNPSRQEFLSPKGVELDGPLRRFETLGSLGACSRATLSTELCERAIRRMREYFAPGKPVYSWFASLGRVVEGMGASFESGTAAHLDLVQEATDPVWSQLRGVGRDEAVSLLASDLPFLKWQIETYPLDAVVCTSARVLREVTKIMAARPIDRGTLARVRWEVWLAETGRGTIGIAGWNIPLARPTGLDKAGHRELGALLAKRLRNAGSGHGWAS
jgi:hypothetical protein